MTYETDREPIKEAIDAYQKTQRKVDFVNEVGNKVYMAEQVWEILDQVFDLIQQCEKCGNVNRIDFKDLY